jgi:hypothetical protein
MAKSLRAKSSRHLSDWIAHVFDHPVTKQEWHWVDDAPQWEDGPGRIALFIAEAFERSGALFAPFSDEQLDQGFWYLVDNSCSEFMYSLVDQSVTPPLRLRALRSFVPLFEQVMAVRCSPHLSHLDEHGANPLNSSCYMWWDIFPIHGCPDVPERAEFDSEVLVVRRRLLAIPHDACRESALHGLGHWSDFYPGVANIIDEFLNRTPNLRPELVAYAKSAKTGGVL